MVPAGGEEVGEDGGRKEGEVNGERSTEMTKDDIMNTPIGSPILVKAWFADATETHALVQFTDEHGKARECWVKHSHVVQPKPEWFRKEQNNG